MILGVPVVPDDESRTPPPGSLAVAWMVTIIDEVS